jgi:divalent metal cation (Fe/Co/Zn/Cd) transporter
VVSVAPDLSTVDAHEIADAIEQRLQEDFAAEDITVHIEPQH